MLIITSGLNRSAISVVPSAAFTLPIPDSKSTTSLPAISPT
ncbi:5'-methylthioadenosine nucleosidase [Listeria monocytogenes]|nr:5'-methylthioadenosine nucleosidase [Listeria monocytogenes]